MQKITPHLWFDKEAKEAAEFYTSLFPDSRVTNVTTLHNTPSGDCDVVSFELSNQSFMAISAGPFFKFNPSISFLLNFNPSQEKHSEENLRKLWDALGQEGTVLMPLQEYSFSKCYGWIQDIYGLSWQLFLADSNSDKRPFITPFFMFVGSINGKAEEAINFYTSVFEHSKHGNITRYGADNKSETEGTLMFADFMLAGQWFAAMDSAQAHDFSFNEALSFMVNCENQREIDYYWERLSAVPEAEQCGWLKDKYGLSWQISPKSLDDMMKHGTREQIDRITKAFLSMKKLDIAALKRAYEEK
ncbi:VOC family protein [Legionella jamestowniensis]|uniref:DNA binding protein n=1 Tax=Legionella jamestowniensis TaxID=455 RepID=A0A0W0UJE7_9GAMM|nr:VOC family protein [Legionella jamestowniensis]KTD07903.1 DNA binding protein [Legionella jamestowniensis]OCH99034.1 hypothetical protein A8135_09830 [Legionella jamestowniensis]SFL63903.1 Glyoxalase superfamily enzyme, possibly 3-demethylubiquinone-9 3-methyltransferase [Legionella jamestowniensis DSM 19215]